MEEFEQRLRQTLRTQAGRAPDSDLVAERVVRAVSAPRRRRQLSGAIAPLLAAASVVVLVALPLVGTALLRPAPHSAVGRTPGTVGSSSSTISPRTPLATAAATSASGATAPLTFTTTTLGGVRGSASWNVSIPILQGSATSPQVNAHVRAAAQNAIGKLPPRCALSGNAEVTRNDGRTVQVRLPLTQDCGGGHRTDAVNTVVVKVAGGAPITLAQVFPDEPGALRLLVPEVRALAESQGEPVPRADRGSLAPVERDWSAWQTTKTGITFDFRNGLLGGSGIRSYTVPWSVLRPLVSAQAYALLS